MCHSGTCDRPATPDTSDAATVIEADAAAAPVATCHVAWERTSDQDDTFLSDKEPTRVTCSGTCGARGNVAHRTGRYSFAVTIQAAGKAFAVGLGIRHGAATENECMLSLAAGAERTGRCALAADTSVGQRSGLPSRVGVDVDLDARTAVFNADGVAVMTVALDADADADFVPLLTLQGTSDATGVFTGQSRDVLAGYAWWGCPD